MNGLLGRAVWRHLLTHPVQLFLTVAGVTLGVAVVVAMDLAIESARESFRLSSTTVAGAATHQVVAGSQGIPDSLFVHLREEAGVRYAAPVVEGWVTTPRLPGEALRVLGLDPFSEAPFRPYLAAGSGGLDAAALLVRRGGVVMSESTAERAALELESRLPVAVYGRPDTLELVGTLRPENELSRRAMSGLLLMDVAEAQRLLEQPGRLSRIDLRLPAGPDGQAQARRVEQLLPPTARLVTAGTRARTFSDMIRAFDLNLTALSLLGVVFGMFLVYNTMTFSVVQRRALIGTLRAMGATRREVVGVVLAEAAVLGAGGSLAGVLLGSLLGRELVRLVTRTINDLWTVLTVDGLRYDPAVLAKGVALGVGAAILAAALPARDAASVEPRQAMLRSLEEDRARRSVPRLAMWGGLLAGVGAALLAPGRSVALAFAGLFGILMGVALLTPLGTVVGVRAATPLLVRSAGTLGAHAARGVVTALSRTAPAMAALVVAVAVTVGLGTMIRSFRSTLTRWLDTTLQADVYGSPPGSGSTRPGGTIPTSVVEALRRVPGVSGMSTYRGLQLESTAYGSVRVVALDLDPRGEGAFEFVGGEDDSRFSAFRREGAVFVSEPFAFRHGVGTGDTIRLPTESGVRSYRVAGVFYDYGSDRGAVFMSRATYRDAWTDGGVTSLAFFADPETDPDELVARLRAVTDPANPLHIRSNRALRAASLEVFDRTFLITSVLRLLVLVVAFIGVLAALMSLQLERRRELGVMRAAGLTPAELGGLVATQTGLMGLLAGLMAVPAGLALAAVMVHVVNRRSFGWTLRMDLGPEVLAQAVALALAGALLAAVYPARRMARTSPAEAIRGE